MPTVSSTSVIKRQHARGKTGVRRKSSIRRLVSPSPAPRKRLHGVAVIRSLAVQVQALNQAALREYTPIVEDLLHSDCRDASQIEHTLDGLLDFCGYEPVLSLYKKLCRHYLSIDPAATANYVGAYREMWDAPSPRRRV